MMEILNLLLTSPHPSSSIYLLQLSPLVSLPYVSEMIFLISTPCLYSRDIDFLHRKSYIDSYTYSHTDHRLSHTLLYRLSHTFLNRLLYSIPSDLTLSLHYNFQCHHYKNITMELWQQFCRINAWGNTSKLTCFSMLSLHKSPPCQ